MMAPFKKDEQKDICRQEENILQEHHHPKPDIGRVEGVVAENGSREQKRANKAERL